MTTFYILNKQKLFTTKNDSGHIDVIKGIYDEQLSHYCEN